MKKKTIIALGIAFIVILVVLISICVLYFYKYMKEERKITEQREYIKNIESDMYITHISPPYGTGIASTGSYILINTKEKNAYRITSSHWFRPITLKERMEGVHEFSYEIKKYELTDENINNLIEYANLSNDDRIYNEEEEKAKTTNTGFTFFLDSYILIKYNGKETKLKPNKDIVIIDSTARLVDTQSSF